MSVLQGNSLTFNIQPSAGYGVGAVTVDGHSVGAVSTYTFSNVQAQHTIAASFAAVSTGAGNIERSGTGYVWARNTTATANANRRARAAINDGVASVGSAINADGEGGLARWEAAGGVWDSPRTVTSVQFVNGKVDSDGNGYFQGHADLQFTTDGSTWNSTGWALTPTHPGTASASGITFTFSGTSADGILGVRVVGPTGSESWSATVNEVMVLGR